MIRTKKIWAIIPARSGSKRLHKKNTRQFHNKPLISWTIKSAVNSKYIDKVIVSTDDTYIANISKFYGAEVPFLRPKKLSNDRASSVDVALHALKKIKANKNDIFILLQPTSPLRNTSHIDNALKIFEKNRFVENVVGISKLDHPIEWSNTVPKNLSMRYFTQKGNSNKRSQDYAPRYLINGSIYILKIRSFFKNRNFILKNNSYGYIMKKNESIDIDNLEDLKLAEYFSKQNNI
jgi:CMP-N,N'-diacetyllegionaminic acid synthase